MKSALHDPHKVSIDFRDELLAKNWLDDQRVFEMTGTRPKANAHHYAAHLRVAGALLGVWVARNRSFRYPDFQFHTQHGLRPEVSDLLRVLPSNEDDRGGWRRAFCLYSPHGLLNGDIPAGVFAGEPQRIVDVAMLEFNEDSDAHW
ncbi:hypothetical protein [Caballeronia sordidicola]|uniref:hypothetical protein n=1 Tax=Caballeronia sordidicola TaxID=196367 RepID=UPI00117D7316|nr:hypothetical protein [Caballeronia sordidicola]